MSSVQTKEQKSFKKDTKRELSIQLQLFAAKNTDMDLFWKKDRYVLVQHGLGGRNGQKTIIKWEKRKNVKFKDKKRKIKTMNL